MATKKQITATTAKIWTIESRTPELGGDRPISTTIPVLDRRRIRGIEFFAIATPRGKLRICESITGGIIADTWITLRGAIEDVPKEKLLEQINNAKPVADKAEELTNEDFFKVYKY